MEKEEAAGQGGISWTRKKQLDKEEAAGQERKKLDMKEEAGQRGSSWTRRKQLNRQVGSSLPWWKAAGQGGSSWTRKKAAGHGGKQLIDRPGCLGCNFR